MMMTTRLTLGALGLLVALVGLPACVGTQPTATPDGQPVELVVNEAIAVTDDRTVLPPVVISLGEAITVADDGTVLPPVVIFASEAITVADVGQVLPPVVISVGESVTVTDDGTVLPPVVISVGEAITVTDDGQVLPGFPPTPTPTPSPTPTPTATPTPTPDPDLAIEKFPNSEFHYGQSGTYTFQIGNVGTGAARSPIKLVDVLPGGFTFDSYSDPFTTDWACTASGQQVTCEYTGPDISPGGFLPALIIAATIAPIEAFPGGSGAVENCAQIQHPDDANPANDESCVSTIITPSGAAG